MSGERPVPLLMAAVPRLVADAANTVPLAPGKLTPGALALWELERAEVRARNAALVAQSVAAQRAEIVAAKLALLNRAQAHETARSAPPPAAPLPPPEASVGSVAWHRAQARAWAKENQARLTNDDLRALTEQVRGRIEDVP